MALVRIARAEYVSAPTIDAHPWRAYAEFERLLRGRMSAGPVSFDRGLGSAACDEGYPLPEAGDRWVVYFWRTGPNTLKVWNSYPEDVALEADERLDRYRRRTAKPRDR